MSYVHEKCNKKGYRMYKACSYILTGFMIFFMTDILYTFLEHGKGLHNTNKQILVP
jgi:hypothetical protein